MLSQSHITSTCYHASLISNIIISLKLLYDVLRQSKYIMQVPIFPKLQNTSFCFLQTLDRSPQTPYVGICWRFPLIFSRFVVDTGGDDVGRTMSRNIHKLSVSCVFLNVVLINICASWVTGKYIHVRFTYKITTWNCLSNFAYIKLSLLALFHLYRLKINCSTYKIIDLIPNYDWLIYSVTRRCKTQP